MRHEPEHGTGRVLGFHGGAVTALTVSENGRLAVSGAEDGAAMVWELERCRLIAELRGHEGAIRDIALSRGDGLAITASDDGTLKVWSLPDGAERSTLEWHGAGVYSVTIESDGRTARSRSYDGHACVWDLASGQAVSAFVEPIAPPDRLGASAGGVFVAPSPVHELLVRDGQDGQVQRALVGHTGRVLCTALHADGRRLVSGGADWTVRLWDTARGTPVVPTIDVAAVAISRDGKLAMAASSDAGLGIWDLATGVLRGSHRDTSARPMAVASLPGGRVLGASEGALSIWSLEGDGAMRTIPAGGGRVISVAAAPGGRHAATLLVTDPGGKPPMHLAIWDLETGTLVSSRECEFRARGLAFADDGHVLVAEPRANAVRRVSVATGETTATFADLGSLTGALVSAPAAGQLVCSVSGGLVVADARAGKAVQSVPIPLAGRSPFAAARCLSVTPDGRFLALVTGGGGPGSRDRSSKVVVYDVCGERAIGSLDLPLAPAALAFSPDGKSLFLGANRQVVRQVVKDRRDDGTGGWFKESRAREPRVFFVDVLSG